MKLKVFYMYECEICTHVQGEKGYFLTKASMSPISCPHCDSGMHEEEIVQTVYIEVDEDE